MFPISSTGTSAGSPKVSVQRSAPSAVMSFSMLVPTPAAPELIGRRRAAVQAFRRSAALPGGQRGQGRGDARLGGRLADAFGEDAGAVLVFEEGEEDVLRSDVVVAEAQGLAEGQVEGLLGVLVEGDERREVAGLRRQRGGGGLPDGVQQDVLPGDGLGREPLGFGDQAEDEVGG